MERRPVNRRALAAAAALVLAGLALATCSNPIDILKSVQTEVMVANDKFLQVTSVGPESNATAVNPSTSVFVQFDRDIDTSSIKPESISVTPVGGGASVDWVFDYDAVTYTLTIYPVALASNTKYNITLTGTLKGKDGSDLQVDYVWSFTTKTGPSGSFVIENDDTYTTATTITLNITKNAQAVQFRWSEDKAKITNNSATGETGKWVPLTIATTTTASIDIGAGEGARTIYVQFWDATWENFTSFVVPASDSITVDTVAPVAGSVLINSDAAFSTASVMLTNSATDATSGVDDMQFSNDNVTWSAYEAYGSSRSSWSLAAGADGARTVYLRVRDAAGNESNVVSDSTTLDTVFPSIATFNINANATYATATGVTLTISASDTNMDQVRYQVNGTWGAWEAYATSKGVTLATGNGYKYVYYQVRDKAGNVTQGSDYIYYDGSNPTVTTFTVGSGNPAYSASTSVTLVIDASDAGSGIQQVRYYYDGAWTSWGAYATSKAITFAAGDGSKTVYYEVQDYAGRVTQVNDAITVDTVPPSVTVFTVGSGNPAATNSTSVTLYITASDATSGLYQSRYGNYGQAWGAWEAFATTKAWTLPDIAGNRSVYLGVKDNAGNMTSINAIHDSIMLNQKLVVAYRSITVTADGDADTKIVNPGEMYYTLTASSTVVSRPSSRTISVAAGGVISSTDLPESSVTVYRDPASSSLTLTAGLADYDSATVSDASTGTLILNAPYSTVSSYVLIDTFASGTVPVAGRAYFTSTPQRTVSNDP